MHIDQKYVYNLYLNIVYRYKITDIMKMLGFG